MDSRLRGKDGGWVACHNGGGQSRSSREATDEAISRRHRDDGGDAVGVGGELPAHGGVRPRGGAASGALGDRPREHPRRLRVRRGPQRDRGGHGRDRAARPGRPLPGARRGAGERVGHLPGIRLPGARRRGVAQLVRDVRTGGRDRRQVQQSAHGGRGVHHAGQGARAVRHAAGTRRDAGLQGQGRAGELPRAVRSGRRDGVPADGRRGRACEHGDAPAAGQGQRLLDRRGEHVELRRHRPRRATSTWRSTRASA